MRKSIKFYSGNDYVEVDQQEDDAISVTINYWPDEGSGVSGESISFSVDEFLEFTNECFAFVSAIISKRPGGK